MPVPTMAQIVKAIDAPRAATDWATHVTEWSALYACVTPEVSYKFGAQSFKRRRRSLRMGKRVPEDWANLCWTENASVMAGVEGDATGELMESHFGPSFAPRFTAFLIHVAATG